MPPGRFSRTSALATLARQEPLTDDDWLAMLEARRELIKRHLSDMTLRTLLDLVYWDKPVSVTAQLSSDFMGWKQQGIFGEPEWQEVDSHTQRIWALLRSGDWVWVVIRLDPAGLWKPAHERKVVSIDLWPASAKQFQDAGLDLRNIWSSLAVVARVWQRRRQALAKVADELVAEIDSDEAGLSQWQAHQDEATRAH